MNKSINARQKIINAASHAQECKLHAMKYQAMRLDAFMKEMGAEGDQAEQLKIQLKDQINICLGLDKLKEYIK